MVAPPERRVRPTTITIATGWMWGSRGRRTPTLLVGGASGSLMAKRLASTVSGACQITAGERSSARSLARGGVRAREGEVGVREAAGDQAPRSDKHEGWGSRGAPTRRVGGGPKSLMDSGVLTACQMLVQITAGLAGVRPEVSRVRARTGVGSAVRPAGEEGGLVDPWLGYGPEAGAANRGRGRAPERRPQTKCDATPRLRPSVPSPCLAPGGSPPRPSGAGCQGRVEPTRRR